MPFSEVPPVEGSQCQGGLPEDAIFAAYDAADAQFPSSAQGRWLRPAIEAALIAARPLLRDDELERLRAENERLREALTAIRGPIKLGLDLDYVRTAAVIDVALGGSQAKGSE